MFKRVMSWLFEPRVCNIDTYFKELDKGMHHLVERFDVIEKRLTEELIEITDAMEHYKGLVETIGETVPDMLWCKDLHGKYIYANKAIREGLLFDDNPIGKTDIQLAKAAKARFGETEHTFGEKCFNSDVVIKETGVKQRFLESGKIKGRMVYLEVYKAPFIVDGEVVGVAGVGRDMTEYVEAFREHNCNGCLKMEDIFKKYEYGEGL